MNVRWKGIRRGHAASGLLAGWERRGGAWRRLLCLLAALLAVSGPALADTEAGEAGDADAVELGWRLEQGQSARYEVTAKQTSQQHVGGRTFETRQVQTVVYRLTVQERAADGSARVTCRYERVAIDLDQMLLGRIAWDSDDPADARRARDPSVMPFAALVGRTFSFRLLPDGTVPLESIRDYDEIREAVLEPIGDNPFARQALEPAFSDGAMQAQLERAFRVVPAEPVSPGATWRREVVQPVPLLGTLRYDSGFELASVEGDRARVRVETLIDVAPPAQGPREADDTYSIAEEALAVELESGRGHGEAVFSLEDGWLLSSEMEARMTVISSVREPIAPAEGRGARSARAEVHQRLSVVRLP